MKKQLPYVLASLSGFVILAFIYFYPLLAGNKLFQQDIMQYRGGAEEQIEYRDTFDKETYWSDSMFSGMPTYQSGAQYSNDFLKYIDKAFGLFLPRPANYFFMMFAGFFFLGMLWLNDWKYAFAGALFFGFSTYFYQITEAGHNAKVHTIAYFAPFVGGLWLLYRNKFVLGFIITTLFLGLQLNANHPQMTFYLFVALSAFGIYHLYFAIKNKKIPDFLKSTGILIMAVLFAVGLNSARLLSTYQYSKESTRGKSELSQTNDESTSGLNRDYITDWSYGILETANLMIPNFYGGGSNEADFKSPKFDDAQKALQSKFYRKAEPYMIQADSLEKVLTADPGNQPAVQEYEAIQAQLGELQNQYSSALQGYSGSYWGNQPFTSGAAYEGCIVMLLGILALFWIRHPYKWWLIGATLLSFMMAWGKNFPMFTNFMIDHFPFYNKFRAVSSALVVAEFTIPALAILGLYEFTKAKSEDIEKKNFQSYVIVGGSIMLLLIVLYAVGDKILPFSNEVERSNMSEDILNALKQDRFAFFRKDVLRTGLYIGLALAVIYGFIKKYLKESWMLLAALVLLSTIDLWSVDRRYLNEDSFVAAKYMNNPFPTDITELMYSDMQKQPRLQNIFAMAPMNKMLKDIKEKDKSTYRVFNNCLNPFQENNTSFFHQSIGGYHGAKLKRYQEVIDSYLSEEPSLEILNMLNAKYIVSGEVQQPRQVPNPNANGNAWFVQNVKVAQSPDEEFAFLKDIDSKKNAIVPKGTELNLSQQTDSAAAIALQTYQPNKLTYQSRSKADQFAVFSEIYYPDGWTAKIDGSEVPIIKADYLLRGLQIPAGEHIIVFEFQPNVVKAGTQIQLWTFILFLLLIGFAYYKNRDEVNKWFANLKK